MSASGSTVGTAGSNKLADIASRGIAFAIVALFWWLWLSLWLGIVVSVAGSRSVDASPAALLAGAGIAATALVGLGLAFMNLLFGAAREQALRFLLFCGAYWRDVAAAVATIVLIIVGCMGGLAALAAVICGYGAALSSAIALVLEAADLVNTFGGDLTAESLVPIGIAFTRMYAGLALVVGLAAVSYVGGRWILRRAEPSVRRGSL